MLGTHFGLIFSKGICNFSTQYTNWEAKASLIYSCEFVSDSAKVCKTIIQTSQISTSSLLRPTCRRTLGMAAIGPMPIYLGSTPKFLLSTIQQTTRGHQLTSNSTPNPLTQNLPTFLLSSPPCRHETKCSAITYTACIPGCGRSIAPIRKHWF